MQLVNSCERGGMHVEGKRAKGNVFTAGMNSTKIVLMD
jgi:hypothetical protein